MKRSTPRSIASVVVSRSWRASAPPRSLLIAFLCLVITQSVGMATSPVQQANAVIHKETRRAMWTRFEIVACGPAHPRLVEAADAAFDEIDRLDAQLSNYSETSELTYINNNAAREAVRVEPELFDLLRLSLDFSRSTDGAFDITVGPLMKSWGFFKQQGRIPAASELSSVLGRIGYRHVTLDPHARTIRFDREGVELDLGAIAKGYAVDKAAAVLQESGVRSALISSGGSTIYAMGAPPDRASCRVEVRDPLDPGRRLDHLEIKDRAVSTSGCTERVFKAGGKTYCHIIDPRTGYPVEGLASVTVVTKLGVDADALSTAVMVMGLEKARAFLKARPDIGAILYYRTPDGGLMSQRLNLTKE